MKPKFKVGDVVRIKGLRDCQVLIVTDPDSIIVYWQAKKGHLATSEIRSYERSAVEEAVPGYIGGARSAVRYVSFVVCMGDDDGCEGFGRWSVPECDLELCKPEAK